MTERTWLKCTDPIKMIGFLVQLDNEEKARLYSDAALDEVLFKIKATLRKARLFACACYRQVAWKGFVPEALELHADGLLADSQRDEIIATLTDIVGSGLWHNSDPWTVAYMATECRNCRKRSREATALRKKQCILLRDVFADPFRPCAIDVRWLTSDVFDLANTIYEQRAYSRMPILGDALMDAGCDREEIINHCQNNEPHYRGCWVVDLLLKKNELKMPKVFDDEEMRLKRQ